MKKYYFLIVIILAIVLVGETLYYENKLELVFNFIEVNKIKETNLTDEALKEKIGQMIMVGFRGIKASKNSDIYKIIRDVKVGGVVLSDYDVSSNSFPRNIINPEQTKRLISDIQNYSVNPLFVGVDAEGGNINRLKQQYGFLPISSPEKMGRDKTLETTKKESAKLAKELRDLGFNMNFAPVVDLNINPKNPIIGALGRSFSSDKEEVVNHSRVFIESHLENNIITVAKHFSGQGSAVEDSHIGIVDVTNTYKNEELFPYQKLNEEGLLNMVMTAHIINKKIDGKYPATLSEKFLKEILRKQIGFKGVIISDDIQMAAISKNYKFDEAVVRAINSGVDIIYAFNNIPGEYDKEMAYKIRDIIFNAVKEKKIEEKRIIESYGRILNLKKKFGITKSAMLQNKKDEIIKEATKIKNRTFKLIGEPNTLTFGEALDITEYVKSITEVRPAFLLAILQEELTLVDKFGMCYLTNFETGEGIRVADGKSLSRVMNPARDIQDFLDITQGLGRNPSKTLVTCPMSFGWGGAMGPADFIPSTWMKIKDRLQKITGKPADPWNVQDAFLASGLYLSDSGAASKDPNGEWNAAMLYFSLSINSPYTWYASDVLSIAEKLQSDIDIIKKAAIQ